MNWFNKKQPDKLEPQLPPEHQASIEIVAHKNASQEVTEEAKRANEVVQDLFKRNHFTVKIYVGTGGNFAKQTHRQGKA